MQIHAKSDNPRISVWDIVIRMVANAWYPIHYFRLSFGKSDSLFEIVMELQRITQIPIDANAETIIEGLTERLQDKQICKLLNILTLNVPYRFLRPWIDTSDDKEMVRRSQAFENGCLYSLHKETGDFYIILNLIIYSLIFLSNFGCSRRLSNLVFDLRIFEIISQYIGAAIL